MASAQNLVWRFIDSGAKDGAFNMAADEALATKIESNVPTLRVYKWRPFTISLGFHQKISDLDKTKCHRDGFGIVRRPTGGRAIFHAQEITYCVIIPKSHRLFQKNTLEVYNEISNAIIKGLNKLDLNLTLEKTENASSNFSDYHKKFACFATTAKYEIHYKSKKVVGSAQRRYEEALLQHGSIIVGDEHLKLIDYLINPKKEESAAALNLLTPIIPPVPNRLHSAFDREPALGMHELSGLSEKTISLSAILKRKIPDEDVIINLKTGFEQYFGIKFEINPFIPKELDVINQLKIALL